MGYGNSPLWDGLSTYPPFDGMAESGNMSSDSPEGTSQRCGKASGVCYVGGFSPLSVPAPALTTGELVRRLSARGVDVGDGSAAAAAVERVGYHHLNAYVPAVAKAMGGSPTLAAVYNAYVFDNMVQAVFLEYAAHFETAFRSQFANRLASEFGPLAHLNAGAFKDAEAHARMFSIYRRELRRKVGAGEPSARRGMARYGDLPVWEAVEAMSFGTLSKAYGNLAPSGARRAVASFFGVDSSILANWTRSLSAVRNECAHQGTLYGREVVRPPRRTRELASCDNRSMFCQFVMLACLFRPNMRDLSLPMTCALRRAIELPPFPLAWPLGFEDGNVDDGLPAWAGMLCDRGGIDAGLTTRYVRSEAHAANLRLEVT